MKHYSVTITIAVALIIAVVMARHAALAQNASDQSMNPSDGTRAREMTSASAATNHPDGDAVPVTEMPAGYRDWRLISVAHEEGNLHSFAVVLGNDTAIQAYRAGTLPFPDGTIIAALHYHHVPSAENNKIFGQEQSFVPGAPSNVQFMIKDSKKYATTGGWGFGHFVDGKPVTDVVKIEGCYECHARDPEHDLVFAHYAP
ncbi:MAG TPA: cytochrome P460 family protein [Pseudomonadales bacterium]|nr:cytochrome P460 family protein [Pseudomonadales bacterium]